MGPIRSTSWFVTCALSRTCHFLRYRVKRGRAETTEAVPQMLMIHAEFCLFIKGRICCECHPLTWTAIRPTGDRWRWLVRASAARHSRERKINERHQGFSLQRSDSKTVVLHRSFGQTCEISLGIQIKDCDNCSERYGILKYNAGPVAVRRSGTQQATNASQ